MREQPLDLRRSLAILRRRRIALAVFAVLGMVGAIFYTVGRAPEGRAAAEVLLPGTTASGAATTQMDTQTQVIIATSSSVLKPAAASVSPPLTLDRLEHLISASAADTTVLRIEARAESSERAVQLLGAVTKQYQNYVETHKAVNGATTLIEAPAAVPPPSTIRLLVKYGLLGLVAGLLAGAIIVLFRARPDHRLRGRDQIAGAIGVPVLASMEAEQYKGIADWKRLLEHFDPSAMNAWTLRPVIKGLVPADFNGQHTIRVLSFIGDKAALAAGPELALFAAASGIPTRLAPSEDPAQEPLRAACAALRFSNGVERPLTFGADDDSVDGEIHPTNRWSSDQDSAETRLVVSVVTVDPAHPELDASIGPTVLSVSSGFAVVDDLARVALASEKVGPGLDGIVVVNPDPRDNTTGSLPSPMVVRWRAEESNGHEGAGSTTNIRSTTNLTGRTRWRA